MLNLTVSVIGGEPGKCFNKCVAIKIAVFISGSLFLRFLLRRFSLRCFLWGNFLHRLLGLLRGLFCLSGRLLFSSSLLCCLLWRGLLLHNLLLRLLSLLSCGLLCLLWVVYFKFLCDFMC